jgi:hypothetical protein
MARRHQTLEDKIAEALADDEKPKPASLITCVHVGHAGPARPVDEIDLGKKTWDPVTLARRIRGRVENYSEPLEGIQPFELRVYYGSDEHVTVYPFNMIEGEVSTNSGEHIRERANGSGQVAQLMRHLETREKLLVGFIQGVVTSQMESMGTLQREVFDAYTIIRQLIMQQTQDMHKMQQDALNAEQSRKEREKLLGYAPGLLNTIFGKELISNTTVDTSIVETLAEKVTPEQVDQLVMLGVIPAEGALVVKSRLQEIRDKKKAEQEAIKKVPPISTELATLNGQETAE